MVDRKDLVTAVSTAVSYFGSLPLEALLDAGCAGCPCTRTGQSAQGFEYFFALMLYLVGAGHIGDAELLVSDKYMRDRTRDGLFLEA